MASVAALLDGGEVAVTSYVGAHGPHTITGGVMRQQIDWKAIEKDLGRDNVYEKLHEIFYKESLGPFYEQRGSPRLEKLAVVSTSYQNDWIVPFDIATEFNSILRSMAGTVDVDIRPGGHVRAFTSMDDYLHRIRYSFELLQQAREK